MTKQFPLRPESKWHSLVHIQDKSTYFRAEVGRAALTADPSCAVHQDLLVSEQFEVLVDVVGEVTELTDVRGQTPSKLALEGKNNHGSE